jgi:superfamily II DNA/RNA helicase
MLSTVAIHAARNSVAGIGGCCAGVRQAPSASAGQAARNAVAIRGRALRVENWPVENSNVGRTRAEVVAPGGPPRNRLMCWTLMLDGIAAQGWNGATVPTFAELGICEPVCRAMAERGRVEAWPVQIGVAGPMLQGQDVLVLAPGGTGKSLAFALPLLQRLTESTARAGSKEPVALVLAGSRESAEQTALSLDDAGRYLLLRGTVAADGANWNKAQSDLRTGVEILVATPRRLLELLRQRQVALHSVAMVVVDDADLLLDQGLQLELDKLLARLPGQRQSIVVAATQTAAVEQLARDWLREPIFVDTGGTVAGTAPRRKGAQRQGAQRQPAPRAPAAAPPTGPVTLPAWLDAPAAATSGPSRKQPQRTANPAAKTAPAAAAAAGGLAVTGELVLFVAQADKPALLRHLLAKPGVQTAVVFVREGETAAQLAEELAADGIRTVALHSDLPRDERDQVFAHFGRQVRVLVSTDTVARVMPLPRANLVVHYEPPRKATDVAVRGQSAPTALFLCAPAEQRFLRTIEHVLGYGLPIVEHHPFSDGGAGGGAGDARTAADAAAPPPPDTAPPIQDVGQDVGGDVDEGIADEIADAVVGARGATARRPAQKAKPPARKKRKSTTRRARG